MAADSVTSLRPDDVRDPARDALDAIADGVLVVGADGRILRANTTARELKRRGVVPTRLPGRGPVATRPPVKTTRNGRSYLWIYQPLPRRRADAGTRALVFITEPHLVRTPGAMWLRARFGLSRAESDLTLALLDGLSLSEAAARRRVQPSTVRSQLRSVFRKTETKRQAELVAKVLRATPRLRDPS